MIVTRLHGRTGNQMFQYAAGRALAALRGTGVALDERTALHKGEGSIARVFALPRDKPLTLPPARHEAPVAHFLWRATGRDPVFCRERGLGYNPRFRDFPANAYLHGYWQSARYFAAIEDDIRAAFRFRIGPSPANAEMAARIGDTLAVSLHVRRGDYVSAQPHGLCEQAYYDAALDWLLPRLPAAPTVFVFSDDPGWARDNLALPCDKVVVDLNGPQTDYEDLRLMALCDHHVIANSSFSWWGAWLNAKPGRLVAAPARWFGDPKMHNPDILPDGWHPVAV